MKRFFVYLVPTLLLTNYGAYAKADAKSCEAKPAPAKKITSKKGSKWTNDLNGRMPQPAVTTPDSASTSAANQSPKKGNEWTQQLNNDASQKRVSAKRVKDIRECLVTEDSQQKTIHELIDSCLPNTLTDTSPVDEIIEETTNKFGGMYLGLGATFSGDRASYVGNSAHFVTKYGASSHSFGGVLFLGYNFKIGCKSYLGLELQAGMDNLDLKPIDTEGSTTLDTFDVHLKKNWRGSFVARFGYLIMPRTAVFIGVGFDVTSWNFNSRNISTNQTSAGAQADLDTKKTFHKFGISPRVGFEYNMCEHNIFIRAEYAIFLTQYMSMTQRIFANGGFAGYPSDQYQHKIRPVQHTFTIAIGWRF